MLRRFFKDGVLYGLGGTISKALAVLIVPIYTRWLSQQDFGALEYLAVVGTIASFVVSLNITQGLARYFAQTPSPIARKALVSSGFWFVLFTFFLFLIPAQIWAQPLSDLLLGSGWVNAFRLATISFFTTEVFYYFQNQLRWSMLAKRYAIATVINVILKLSLAVSLVVGARWGIEGIFLATILADLFASVIAWCCCRQLYGWILNLRRLKMMLVFSIPLVPNSIAAFLATFLDRLMIKYYMNLEEVGIYSLGAKVAASVGLVLGGFQTAVLPLVYEHLKQSDTPRHLARIFRHFLALCLAIIVLIGAFSREITAVMGPASYAPAAGVMAILSGAVLLTGMKVFSPGISISRKTWLYFVGNGTALAVNVLLNWLWIPRWGIFGASLATLCSAVVGMAITAVIGQRFYAIPHVWWRAVFVALLVTAVLLGETWLVPAQLGVVALIGKITLNLAFALTVGLLMLGWRETTLILQAVKLRRR